MYFDYVVINLLAKWQTFVTNESRNRYSLRAFRPCFFN